MHKGGVNQASGLMCQAISGCRPLGPCAPAMRRRGDTCCTFSSGDGLGINSQFMGFIPTKPVLVKAIVTDGTIYWFLLRMNRYLGNQRMNHYNGILLVILSPFAHHFYRSPPDQPFNLSLQLPSQYLGCDPPGYSTMSDGNPTVTSSATGTSGTSRHPSFVLEPRLPFAEAPTLILEKANCCHANLESKALIDAC